MSSYCVIGSGISGATIANLLSKKNPVDIYDKARGPGGRCSFKRLNNSKGFDHGAQYVSPKSIQFKIFIEKLLKKKILKVWRGKHIYLNKSKKNNKKHIKIIGTRGNNDICKYLIKNIKSHFLSELDKIKFTNNKWKLDFKNNQTRYYDNLILTCPFPQLKKLTKKFIKDPFIKKKIKMDANITVMIKIKKTDKNVSSYLFNDKILGWAAKENSKKRFKSNYDLWTLQSTHGWANKRINKNRENKENNSKILIDKFFKLSGIQQTRVLTSLNHGWKYSSNSRPFKLKSYWNTKLNLGVCADWFVGPRVEDGWISANDLFKKMNK